MHENLKTSIGPNPKTWLVTGAAGFIGSALCEALLALGQRVVGLDNFATGHRKNINEIEKACSSKPDVFRFIEGDITHPSACKEAAQGVDIVLHQAALGSVPRSIKNPIASHEANVNGFLNMILAARDANVKRFVFASSSSVYGDHPDLPKVEQNIGKQLSPYAVTKRIDEIYAGVVQDSYGLETVGLRYFNVFGRRQDPNGPYAAVIPKWIAQLADGNPCDVFGDGTQSRDFCYIDNVIQANILAATTDGQNTNHVYNVGCDGNTSLLDLHEKLKDRVSIKFPEASKLSPRHTDPRPGDVKHSQAAIKKISSRLGYKPSHDVDTGLSKTVDWFLEHSNYF